MKFNGNSNESTILQSNNIEKDSSHYKEILKDSFDNNDITVEIKNDESDNHDITVEIKNDESDNNDITVETINNESDENDESDESDKEGDNTKNVNNVDKIYLNNENHYFLDGMISYFKKNKKAFLLFLLLTTSINITAFFYRTKFWIYFNKKENILPMGTAKNTTYYLTASIINIETIADDYISEMKKLINYLGDENVMVSIVENGDSKDNTRDYLLQFQEYLNEKNIRNKFVLTHEVDDPRKTNLNIPNDILKNSRLSYYVPLRNKALDLLYETNDIDFDNTKIIYFNDVIFFV